MEVKRSVKFSGEVIILDIEGTTTSISFVKETLFPYITKTLETYLQTTFETSQTSADVTSLRDLAREDAESGNSESPQILDGDRDSVIDTVVENVKWQMSKDRKSTALKQLQGHMWKEAYQSGEVKGHLYPEVSECVKSWHETGVRVCIYSSGSVSAQKLLFGFSQDGDMTALISAYFDTKIGMKRDSESYTNISNELDVKADQVLFLTDIPEEAESAVQAGMRSIIVNRPGNAPLTEKQLNSFTVIESFDQIDVLYRRPVKQPAANEDSTGTNNAAEIKPSDEIIKPSDEKIKPSEEVKTGELEHENSEESGEPPAKRKAE